MKTAFFLLTLLASIGLAHAGSFGGPPPFTNGSPLVSGVDGSYQATARGTNLTGVFRFTYSSGVQTSDPSLGSGVSNLLVDPYNDYVFFVNGVVFRGLVQANINVNSISGVLDNGGANIYNYNSGGTQLTVNSYLSGYFNGSMDENSPNASFQGVGSVTATSFVDPNAPDGSKPPAGTILDTYVTGYKFRGVRAAISSSSSSGT